MASSRNAFSPPHHGSSHNAFSSPPPPWLVTQRVFSPPPWLVTQRVFSPSPHHGSSHNAFSLPPHHGFVTQRAFSPSPHHGSSHNAFSPPPTMASSRNAFSAPPPHHGSSRNAFSLPTNGCLKWNHIPFPLFSEEPITNQVLRDEPKQRLRRRLRITRLPKNNFASWPPAVTQTKENRSRKNITFCHYIPPCSAKSQTNSNGKMEFIENQPFLKTIYKNPSVISYKRCKSLKDTLVRAKM